jgi:hypothetical protein
MKTISFIAMLVLGVSGNAYALTLFQDNFTGSTLNPTNWTTNLYGSCSIAQSNGTVVLSSSPYTDSSYTRPVLTTSKGFNQPISVSGTFKLGSSFNDYFHFTTRSSGAAAAYYYEPYGLGVEILTPNQYGGPQCSAQFIYTTPSGSTQFCRTDFSFDTTAVNSYKFIDYGNRAVLYLNGTLILDSAVDPNFSQGDKVSFTYIGGGASPTTLGPVTIDAIPYEVTLITKSSTNLSSWSSVITNKIETYNPTEFYKTDISVTIKPPAP